MHDYDTSEQVRRGAAVAARAHDAAWEGARRAAANGDGSSASASAVLRLQRLAGNAGVGALVAREEDESARSPVLDVVGKGSGSPLPETVRGDMEQQLGADFGDVRVHDGGAAASSAAAVQAKAYTVGNEVVFNSGAYAPDSDDGRRTLAHELTHVVQQRSGPVEGTPTGDGVAVSHPADRFEQEAEATASSLGPAGDVGATAQRHGLEDDSAGPVSAVQREGMEDEEPVQELALQREELPEEEEPVQATALQREEIEDEEAAP